MTEQKKDQSGFPQNQPRTSDEHSTTGDGHPPRTGERATQEGTAGQGLGQMSGSTIGTGFAKNESTGLGGGMGDTISGRPAGGRPDEQ